MGPLLGVWRGRFGDNFCGDLGVIDSDGLGTGCVKTFSFSLSLDMSTSSSGCSIILYGASSSNKSIITDGFWFALTGFEVFLGGLLSRSKRFLAQPFSVVCGKLTETIILSPEVNTDFSEGFSLKSFL